MTSSLDRAGEAPKFEYLADTPEVNKQFWADANKVRGIPDASCSAIIPSGTIVWDGRWFRRTLEPVAVDVPERGTTNYDNQRRVFTGEDAFYIVVAADLIPEGSDLAEHPVTEAMKKIERRAKDVTNDD